MKRGSITLYLSLMLPLLVAVLTASIFSVQVQADRTQLANAMDQALYSLLAQYDRELFARYDVFFLDGACGAEGLHAEKLQERLERAMRDVLSPEKTVLTIGTARLFDVACTDLACDGMGFASDLQGRVFEAQAIASAKERSGMQAVSRLLTLSGGAGQAAPAGEGAAIMAAWEGGGAVDLAADAAANADTATDETPAAEVTLEESEHALMGFLRELWQAPLLAAAVPGTCSVSEKATALSALASQRPLQQGFGVIELPGTDFGVADVLLYKEYLIRHFGDFLAPTADALLSYQLEYLIAGHEKDADNLADVLGRILLLREGVNLVCLLSDSSKMAQAKALAEVLAALVLNPELAPAFEALLLGAWAYGESCIDLHALLLGKRIAVTKDAESWQLSLTNLPLLLDGGVDGLIKEAEIGLSYRDFLRLFLLPMKEETLNLRALDMIECTMRGLGRTQFSMDTQIYMLSFSVSAMAEGQIPLRGEKKYSYADFA